jgi:hypothetical protein
MPDRWIGSDSQEVRGLVIEAQGLQRSDEPARPPGGDGTCLFTNGAGQRAGQRVSQQLADAKHIPRDQGTTERIEEGEHERPRGFVFNSHLATKVTTNANCGV